MQTPLVQKEGNGEIAGSSALEIEGVCLSSKGQACPRWDPYLWGEADKLVGFFLCLLFLRCS